MSFIVFLVLLIFLTVCFWPALWKDPIRQFFQALRTMSHFPWQGSVLYMGKRILPAEAPWHYIPVWLVITTPLVYSLNLVIGFSSSILEMIKKPLGLLASAERRNNLLFFLWFFGPLVTVIILKSTLFDSWRHMFFIYPAFLLISVRGMLSLLNLFKSKKRLFRMAGIVFILVIVSRLIHTAHFMAVNHPHQNVYFNALAGHRLRSHWELDYWGVSYRQALEYILKNDPRNVIPITVENLPGKLNAMILTPEDQKRLSYVKDPKEADYFLSEYRGHPEDYPYPNKFYSITVGQAEIMVVFKLK